MRRSDSCLVPKAGVPVEMTAQNRHAVLHPNAADLGLWLRDQWKKRDDADCTLEIPERGDIRQPRVQTPSSGASTGRNPGYPQRPSTNPEGVE